MSPAVMQHFTQAFNERLEAGLRVHVHILVRIEHVIVKLNTEHFIPLGLVAWCVLELNPFGVAVAIGAHAVAHDISMIGVPRVL